jgi:hypothetical protein
VLADPLLTIGVDAELSRTRSWLPLRRRTGRESATAASAVRWYGGRSEDAAIRLADAPPDFVEAGLSQMRSVEAVEPGLLLASRCFRSRHERDCAD